MLMAASRAQVASISAIATNRFSTCSGVALETIAPLRGRMSIRPLIVSCRSASRTGVRDTPCCCARPISSSRDAGLQRAVEDAVGDRGGEFFGQGWIFRSACRPIAYKIGANANSCSSNAQIECNLPKLHTIKPRPHRRKVAARRPSTCVKARQTEPFRPSRPCWHTACCRLSRPPRPAPSRRQQHDRQVHHRPSRPARQRGGSGRPRSWRHGPRAEAAGGRLHLCRAARRLRLQPGARRGRRHR